MPHSGKENAPPQRRALSADHRKSLITCSFRAAKVSYDHKRPYPPCSGDANDSRPAKMSPRLPLMEIHESPIYVPYIADAMSTPPASALLEEDFDEATLREIDEICERRSISKEVKSEIQCSGATPLLTEDNNTPREYVEYWKKLNDKQREAACSDISVPLVIVAGPGSGKTSTMVGRVLMLLKEGITAKSILAMTFTTAAAAEMRDRVGGVVGKAVAKELEISTFHSFCLQLCRMHAEKLGRTAEFLVYGHAQQRRAIVEALRISTDQQKNDQAFQNLGDGINFNSLKERSKKWEKFVTQAKASGKTPDEFRQMGNEFGARILSSYNDILKSCNALDYHDFITSSVALLTEFPEVFKQCQESWRAIVVDEFQDTSCMQYKLLKILGSHRCLTVIGDEDQSIFSFNGANICGFDSFRKDFPNHKEVRLTMNYRSTRCIIEAASSLIHYNVNRCRSKSVDTDNSSGSKITVRECSNEAAQCAYVVDKILEITSSSNCSVGDVAVLYRRQATGRAFQTAFRERKIPFNVHGVAFYRKKVIKAILAILGTTMPGCGDLTHRRAFKSLLNCDKEEKKKVIDYIDKILIARKCSFFEAATDIFSAKVSGTFKRAQLSEGRKVLSTLDMVRKLVEREQSITAVISSVAAVLPQKYLLEKQAITDVDSGKYLNEDRDLRSSLQYLLDDLSEFLSRHFNDISEEHGANPEALGCHNIVKAFLDHICTREAENFRVRRCENKNSVTLTTIHQSKGLEWDTVFIVKANESEIPLLHECNGIVGDGGATLEEERRLLYVAMTRARKKLYILYVLMDSNWQLLHPSRFLREIPNRLIEDKVNDSSSEAEKVSIDDGLNGAFTSVIEAPRCNSSAEKADKCHSEKHSEYSMYDANILSEEGLSNVFLKEFKVEDRAIISHIFHHWAKKSAFQNAKRLLDKVGFVIDERLRKKTNKNKGTLRSLKAKLCSDEAFQYAQHVLRWEQIPTDKRIHLMREKQEHFQKLRIEKSMESSEATSKQISYLQMLGCTVAPTSRLHASHLIEQYKSL